MTTTISAELCQAQTPDGPCRRPPHGRGFHDANPPVIRVPRDAQGRPKLSITQFRRYGAVELATVDDDGAEKTRGCPRAYALTYGGDPVPEFPSPAAELGAVLHRALHQMETTATGPHEALQDVWPATLGPRAYAEASRILDRYLTRGAPEDATLATELDLTYSLYVDNTFGEVLFRGILDRVSVDTHDPDIVHVTDYKSNARPIPKEDLRGDVQILGYSWLVRQWFKDKFGHWPRRVIAHLDLLRYSNIPIEFTKSELDNWEAWATAMARTMLRDNDPRPILNDGCTWCPVRDTCPAWLALPETAVTAGARLARATPEQIGTQYVAAAKVLTLLTKQVTERRKVLEAEAANAGSLTVGDQEWVMDVGSVTSANVLGIINLLFDKYPSVLEIAVSASQASVDRAAAAICEEDPTLASQLVACVTTVKAGARIAKRKPKTKKARDGQANQSGAGSDPGGPGPGAGSPGSTS